MKKHLDLLEITKMSIQEIFVFSRQILHLITSEFNFLRFASLLRVPNDL